MAKSIKKNYIFNLLYQLLIVALPIVVTPYVSRILLPSGIGRYSFSLSIISYFVLFAELGFGYYAQREIAKYQENKKMQSKIFFEIMILRGISVLLSLGINLLLVFANVYKDNGVLFSIMTINIFSVAFDIAFYFQGNEEFGKITLKNSIIKILGVVSVFLFVKSADDLWVYVLINSLSIALSNISLWPFVIDRIEKVKLKELKPFSHLKGTLKLFVPTIAISIYAVLDKTLIGVITNNNLENGYYEQAEKIVKIAMTVITCLGTVMIPRNTNEYVLGNTNKIQENIYKAFNFLWLIGIPLTIGIICVSDNFVPWFFGDGYAPVSRLMKILSLLIIVIGVSNILGLQYLVPTKKDRIFSLSLIMGAIINLLLNLILIYRYGSVGAAIATICAEACVSIVMLMSIRRELSIFNCFKTVLKPMISGIVMLLVIKPISTILASSILNFCILVFIGIIVYLAMIIILKEHLCWSILVKLRKLKQNKSMSDK